MVVFVIPGAMVNVAGAAMALQIWRNRLRAGGSCKESPADLTGDGTIGAADLAQLLANWG